jgi:hypothetical protein
LRKIYKTQYRFTHYRKRQGLTANRPPLLPLSRDEQRAAAQGGWRRWRPRVLGARLRCRMGRGDRDEHDWGLTSGGGRRSRPDFAVNRRRAGSVGRLAGGGAACAAGGGALGRRSRGQGRAVAAHSRGFGPPLYGARVRGTPAQGGGGGFCPGRRRNAGPDGPRAGHSRAGGGRRETGSGLRARPS